MKNERFVHYSIVYFSERSKIYAVVRPPSSYKGIRLQGLTEIARVLKPGGRLLVLDFRRSVHGGPWNSDIQDLPALMQETGFSQLETGETAFRGLGFALGRTSRAGGKQ
jgi:hypothetical protein